MSQTKTDPLEAKILALGGESLYEVVNGEIVEPPPMGAHEVNIANILLVRLGSFVHQKDLGRAVMEMLFILNQQRNLQFRPDVAFVSYNVWPKAKSVPKTNAWAVVPELAAEVISPTNTNVETLDKILEYFSSGVQLVWIVYPSSKQIYVYRSPKAIDVLEKTDELDGENIVPGFRLPLTELFD